MKILSPMLGLLTDSGKNLNDINSEYIQMSNSQQAKMQLYAPGYLQN